MRANPGGILAPEDVIGRDPFVGQLWRVLEVQSIVLTSERRIGKTSVIRKMVDAPASQSVCFMRDIEDYRSPNEFIAGICADVQPILSKKERARLAIWGLLERLGGTEIGDLKLPQFTSHWKTLLAALFSDIFSAELGQVVFFWDELPLFLYNVKNTTGERDAMELLDALRSLRQKYANLRMVFTGSVGIHQVIGSLRKHGYANDPTNDMAIIEVPPLEPNEGARLAELLIEGERIQVLDDPVKVCNALSSAAGHIPYYIHYLIARIRNGNGRIQSSEVETCLRELISDPNDPAHFYYYQTRLSTYYGALEAEVALHALDILAAQTSAVAFEHLVNLIKHKTARADEELIRQVLQVLLKDHYICRHSDGSYGFRYSIVQNWWTYTRG
ncbi:MAG TPA: ATP-binding protein [Candidatus Angelobacter sp.]|jgi:hypothetical protein|nr:ATP-binding protein [Candidatus Angelobacter sp.]